MSVEFGWKASAEQFGPRELLELSVLAEGLGFGTVAVSDHFQPWRHTGGHGPSALVWLGAIGQASSNLTLATSVLTPTLRYHPTIVAQAFATLGDLNPGRVILGVGTGEALNEIPATGAEWPSGKERRARLGEAIELIRRLWTEERVTFEGEYYQTRIATIYDRPAEPIPIYMGASGPIAAKMAGRVADGFITTSGKDPALYDQLLGKVEEGAREAGRDFAAMDKMMEIKVSYDHDVEFARKACEWWAALALPGDVKSGVDDPLEMERLADDALDRAHTRFIVTDDPQECVERIRPYVELGFTRLIFHAPGTDQRRFMDQFAADVLPLLRTAFDLPAQARA
jgi:coenzyme F420-dependent glucose-6-phosphate dehydrogenase